MYSTWKTFIWLYSFRSVVKLWKASPLFLVPSWRSPFLEQWFPDLWIMVNCPINIPFPLYLLHEPPLATLVTILKALLATGNLRSRKQPGLLVKSSAVTKFYPNSVFYLQRMGRGLQHLHPCWAIHNFWTREEHSSVPPPPSCPRETQMQLHNTWPSQLALSVVHLWTTLAS